MSSITAILRISGNFGKGRSAEKGPTHLRCKEKPPQNVPCRPPRKAKRAHNGLEDDRCVPSHGELCYETQIVDFQTLYRSLPQATQMGTTLSTPIVNKLYPL